LFARSLAHSLTRQKRYALSQVSNPKGLAIEILGQQIRSISKLNPQTKVIVMDRKGELAKDVARACRAAGVRTAYVMDGGFNGYRRQEGMAVDGRDFYEDGPLALAGDQVESLTSGLKGALSDRKGAAVVLGSIAAATFVGANLHEVLKLVGVLGIEATIVIRYVLGDESLGDDLALALGSFDSLVGGVTSVVGTVSKAASKGENASSS
jgi:rhodanese-related sulfurtransferase